MDAAAAVAAAGGAAALFADLLAGFFAAREADCLVTPLLMARVLAAAGCLAAADPARVPLLLDSPLAPFARRG